MGYRAPVVEGQGDEPHDELSCPARRRLRAQAHGVPHEAAAALRCPGRARATEAARQWISMLPEPVRR